MIRTITSATVALSVVVLLAGCNASASVNFTTSPETLSAEVATALQKEANTPTAPNVDCGEDSIDLVIGETVVCALSVDGDDTVYDATVTITSADGATYGFDVDVADTPR